MSCQTCDRLPCICPFPFRQEIVRTAWLIENQENGASWYLSARLYWREKDGSIKKRFGWSWVSEIERATQFSRQDDAEAVWICARHCVGIGGLDATGPHPTEHIFYENAGEKTANSTPEIGAVAGSQD